MCLFLPDYSTRVSIPGPACVEKLSTKGVSTDHDSHMANEICVLAKQPRLTVRRFKFGYAEMFIWHRVAV